MKKNLNENELIVLMDFSENLSFEIQDAVQSAYFNKPQSTLYTICIYSKSNDKLITKSMIGIAESLKHNVEAVYAFQTKLVEYIKKEYSDAKKIIFFTDGAGSQYKNKKNFLNMCLFQKDFGLMIIWNFFATAHGKSPCDALGGAFKRRVRTYNMQHPTKGLDSASSLFKWTQDNKDGKTEFIFCSLDEYNAFHTNLNNGRFDRKIKTVTGTQSFHSFKPLTETTIECRPFSVSSTTQTFQL